MMQKWEKKLVLFPLLLYNIPIPAKGEEAAWNL